MFTVRLPVTAAGILCHIQNPPPVLSLTEANRLAPWRILIGRAVSQSLCIPHLRIRLNRQTRMLPPALDADTPDVAKGCISVDKKQTPAAAIQHV